MSLNPLHKFQEKKTMAHLRGRDQEAFIKVYDDNAEAIYRFVYFKIGNSEEAKDLSSMIFLKAWNYIQNSGLSEAPTLRALLYKIARNAIIDYYRESGNKLSVSLDDENNKIDIADEDSPDLGDKIDQEAKLKRIREALPLLKDEYREVLVLRFINDLSIEEIAAATDKKRGNIRVLLHRAVAALKDILETESGV